MIAICVAVRDNLELTRQLYDCVERHTEEPHVWVFMDDASDDGTQVWLPSLPAHVRTLRNQEPIGYTLSMNRALEKAAASNPEALVVINNDVLVSYRCLDELIALARGRGVWCVSPRRMVLGCGFDEKSDWHVWERERRQELTDGLERDFLLGACFMLSRDAYGALGGFDEAYAPYWFEDEDYAERLRGAGHPPVQTRRAFVYHYVNKTLENRPTEERHEAWTRNSAYFARKWGHTPKKYEMEVPSGEGSSACGYGRPDGGQVH